MTTSKKCLACMGLGFTIWDDDCIACRGSGEVLPEQHPARPVTAQEDRVLRNAALRSSKRVDHSWAAATHVKGELELRMDPNAARKVDQPTAINEAFWEGVAWGRGCETGLTNATLEQIKDMLVYFKTICEVEPGQHGAWDEADQAALNAVCNALDVQHLRQRMAQRDQAIPIDPDKDL